MLPYTWAEGLGKMSAPLRGSSGSVDVIRGREYRKEGSQFAGLGGTLKKRHMKKYEGNMKKYEGLMKKFFMFSSDFLHISSYFLHIFFTFPSYFFIMSSYFFIVPAFRRRGRRYTYADADRIPEMTPST